MTPLADNGREAAKKLKVHSLIDKVYKPLNLYIAWEKVRDNQGAGGVDGESVRQFEKQRDQNIRELYRELRENRYVPSPVRRVLIAKANGGQRPLGIPTIRDRVVQQALANRMEPIFEGKFKAASYGYRKGKGAQAAVEAVKNLRKEGCSWVVDLDIESFFDSVDHETMLDLVNEEISDGRVLSLIRSFLESGVMEEGKVRYEVSGTPQGGVISPLLANIYLHPLDEVMETKKLGCVRYADDLVIMTRSKQEAEKALREVREFLEGRLKLRIREEKTKIVHYSQGFEFLGFVFGSGYSDYQVPRKRAIDSFKDKIRRATRRQQPKTIEQIIKEVNPIIRGWGNYFVRANVKALYGSLEVWIMHRLRAFKRKRWASQKGLEQWTEERFKSLGLVSLWEIAKRRSTQSRQLTLSPVMGQH